MAQTFWYDANASRLQKAARNQATQTTIVFSFPYHASGVPPIKEGMQVWIGWRDGGSWLQGPDPPWIGYIMELEGGGNGEEHTITAQVSSCQILFTRTDVIGWPIGADTGLGVEGAGYPAGYSVTNWLVGTDPFPGIIRARLQNIDYSGVDPAFDSYILDDAHIPGGNAGKYTVGQWGGGLLLDEVLQDICAEVRMIAQEAGALVTPVYFFDTVAQGSILRPRFRFIDANDASGPIKGVMSVNPASGQYRIRAFKHRRVFTESRTRIVAWGLGTHGSGATAAADFAIYDGHADDYPTEYQVDPGWSGRAYTDEHFENQADCERAAATLGYRLWGALGEITFQVDGVAVGSNVITYFAQGDIIAVDNPAEGLTADSPRVLRNVEMVAGTAGHPVWTLTLGDVVPDAADLIRGATVVQPQQRLNAGGAGHTGAPGAALGPRGLPNVPGRVGIDRQPTHSAQNVIRAVFTDVVDFTGQQATQLRPGADPTDPPTPAVRQLHLDQYGNPRQWLAPEGSDAVHHYTFPVTVAGEYAFTIPDPVTLVEEKILNLDGTVNTDVTTTYLANDVSVPTPSTATPLVCVRDTVLAVTFAGTFPTRGISFKLTSSPTPVVP